MCVKIITKESEFRYNINKPLEEQINKSDKVVINYKPKDKDVPVFIKELERIVKKGINLELSVQINHNDNLEGFKAKKTIKKLQDDLSINDIIKLIVKIQNDAENKLNDLIESCVGSNVK